MAKKLFGTAFLILCALYTFTQTTNLLQEAVDKTITISNESSNKSTQTVLSIVSKTQPSTKLSYSIKEHREIIKNGSQLMIRIAVGNMVRENEYNYQQFSINEYLTPSQVSFTYQLKNAQGEIIDSKAINEKTFKSGEYLIKYSTDSFEGEENCSIELSLLSFDYSTKEAKALDEFVHTVDRYYDVDAQLNLMNQELDKLFLDSIEMLAYNQKICTQNMESIKTIKSYRFESKLHLAAGDPLFFKSNYGKTEVKNRGIKKEIDYKVKYMHETYCKKGMQWLTWKDTIKAATLFDQSIVEKGNYPPPFYQLAAIDYNKNQYTSAIDSCKMIVNKLKPDNDVRYACLKLSEKVIYHFIDSINFYISQREFANAVSKLNTTIAYTKSIEGIKIFNEFNDIYTRLYQAYYDDFVLETEKLLNELSLEEAHFNIDSLSRFRKAHEQYITNPEKEYELQNNLYVAWIDRGKSEQENNRPNNALTAFDNAKKICTLYKEVTCSEELSILLHAQRQIYYVNLLKSARLIIQEELADSALIILADAKQTLTDWKLEPDPLADTLFIDANQIKYNDLVAEGELAVRNYAPREALAFYKEANTLAATIAIIPDSEIEGKVKKAAVALTIIYCSHGETQIDALQINKAFHFLKKAKNLATQYEVIENEEVIQSIKTLEDALNTGECSNAMYKFNIQMKAANKFIEAKDFINAENALNKTKDIAKANEECSLPDSIADELIVEIKPIQHYQISMIEIEQLIEEKSYGNALEKYTSISQYYNDSILNKYGVVLIPMFDYICKDKSDGLKDYAIRHYTENDNTEKSLELLYMLYQKEYSAEWAKKSQVALGVQLAMNDFKKNPNIATDQKVLEYTKDDKWFNHLKKAYLSQWKKL